MNIKSLLVVSFLLVHSLAWAQTIVLPYQPGVTTEGVTYYLPKTRLNILVQASCTTQYPGELHSYAPRCLPTASISSMNIIQGADFLACSNKSLTLDAPTPTNISTKSEPLII